MVLKPLEFTDCLADSPWFRENLRTHEDSLENAAKKIKQIEQHCRKLISCFAKLSHAEKAFAGAVMEFKIDTVGSTQTDDERVIANSVTEFGHLVQQIEGHRAKVIDEAEQHYLLPLQNLAERINKVVRDERHKYNKESTRFYTGLEKHLHLSTVRKNDFREADLQLGLQQKTFCQASLQYVAEIQAVQERIKFEFVETLSSFFYRWLSFYHIGHVIYEDFREHYDGISAKVQKARENFETTQAEAQELKHKMLATHIKNGVFSTSGPSFSDTPIRLANSNIKQGYVYVQEKSILSKTISRDVLPRNWTKYYCVYSKETRIFTMIPVNNSGKTSQRSIDDVTEKRLSWLSVNNAYSQYSLQNMKGTLEQSVSFKLKSCVRRASDSIDKRFCFDVIPEERTEVLTIQALSEEDRRQWLDSMDGREPVYSPGVGLQSVNSMDTMLDENGFDFVRQCLKAIEAQGIREQGIYRNCGVTSKVQRLMQLALDKRKTTVEKLNLSDDSDWETKTISSAIKTFLRNLPEPLMTFDLHSHFINAAKMGDVAQRINHIHYYVYKLPEAHFHMLELIVRHLRLVADNSAENLMTVGNLGVCFGPTLLRPKEETMAAIMDIKFCNVVVEVLITNCYQIFDTKPPQQIGLPCPPKPSHNLTDVISPLASELANASLNASKSANASTSSIPTGDELGNQKSVSAECFLDSYSSESTAPADGSATTTPPSLRAANFAASKQTASSTSSLTAGTMRQRQMPSAGGQPSTTGEMDGSARSTAINEPTYSGYGATYPSAFFSLHSGNGHNNGSRSAAAVAPLADMNSELQNSGESTSSLSNQSQLQLQHPSLQINPHLLQQQHHIKLYQPTSAQNTQQPPQLGGSAFTKTKISASYAPAYNPYACDNITHRLQKRHSGGNLLMSSSAHCNLAHISSGPAPQAPLVSVSTSTLDGGLSGARPSSAKLPLAYHHTHQPSSGDSPRHHYHPQSSAVHGAANVTTAHDGSPTVELPSAAYATRIPHVYSNFINPNVQFQPSRRVRTLYSCTAGHETELSFDPGQIITNVYESKEEGWLVGTLNGKTGLIPANYVEHILGP